jgi:hypothetical protein
MKDLLDTWKNYSIETDVDIRIEPIPSNIEEVFSLNDEKKAVLREKRNLKKNALYIKIYEENANISFYLDETENNVPLDFIQILIANDDKDFEPFRREDDALLRELLKKFSDIMEKLIKPNLNNIKKVYLEASPSDRASEEFGKTILRDVYGMYMIYLGLQHHQIRITEYEFDNDFNLYKNNIPFSPPVSPKNKLYKTI